MNEGMREDAILWEGKPEGRWVFLGVPINRGSLTVMTFQIGIVIRNGEVVDVFSEGKRKLPRFGKVRTYVASTAPFNLTFWLMDPEDPNEPEEGVGLNQPVLTADKQLVTGRIDLTLRATRKNVEYLLQLLRPGRGGVTRRDVSDAIGGELQAKVLDLDIYKYTSEELRGNRELFAGMYESVQIELSSTIRRYGLELDNFYPNWGLTHEEREGIREQRHSAKVRERERRHEEELREIRRRQEIEDLANRERERRQEEELAEIERERERERRHEEELAEIERERERERRHEEELREIRRQQEIEDLANRERERRQEEELAEIERAKDRERRQEEELREMERQREIVEMQRQDGVGGGWIEIGYSFKNGRKSMEDVPGWVKEQIPKYNRMFHTTDRDSGSMFYHFDGGAFTYRISFARVYGGADVRVSRMLMEESSGGNFPPAGNYPAAEVSRPDARPQRSVGYWVYEDRPTSRARVHEGTCRYCNHGDGMGRGRIEAENEWYGPFVSREDAFRRAGATGQRDVRGCGVCRP